MSSSILHFDGDDFYASVARLEQPKLLKRPLIIGHLHSRGATVATSRDIRDLGIVPGVSMTRAKQLCPEATLVQINWPLVHKLSKTFVDLVSRFSPAVEPAGLDSLFVDYTGSERLFGSADSFAVKLQKEIKRQTGFSISAGLAADKAVSVVACRAAKLGGLESVKAGSEKSFLSTCPLSWLPSITGNQVSFFSSLGLQTIGDIARIPIETLEYLFGKTGKIIALQARGSERSRIRASHSDTGLFSQIDFAEDLISTEIIISKLASLSSDLCRKLRQQHKSAKRIHVAVRYSDQRLYSICKSLIVPSNRDHELFRTVKELFLKLYQRRVRVRSISIHASSAISITGELPFGEAEQRNKWNKALLSVDRACSKFSPNAIQLAESLVSTKNQDFQKRKETHHIYRN